MKTLTICQPYAELIMLGEKRVENRTWYTNCRGWLGIHAGMSRSWLDSYRPLPGKMEFGALVGYARLVDCKSIVRLRENRELYESLQPHAEGPFCWILEDVRRFVEPIAMPGKQGLFEVEDRHFSAPYVLAGPRCRICGCTNDNACPEGCSWIEPDLCSSCTEENSEVHPLLG